MKSVNAILVRAALFTVLCSADCRTFVRNEPVEFIDRKVAFLRDTKSDPLILIVEITETGKLSLNKIEIGRIDDPAVISEKVSGIFDDREKAGISQREILIEMKGRIKIADLERLIDSLIEVKASPVRIIKNNP